MISVSRRCAGLYAALLVFTVALAAAASEHECAGGRAIQAAFDEFDPAIGSDPRKYAPDPQVDYLHLRLDMRFDDPMTRTFEAQETIRFKTLGLPLTHLHLDAVELAIREVTDSAGKPLVFDYDEQELTVHFDPPLPPDTESGVKIRYRCANPKAGMWFALPDDGYPDRPLMIHTQGEAEYNRYWLVAHDSPNERCTTEIAVDIPDKYTALANGKLVAREAAGAGRVKYHYRLDQPHVAYLISLVIGEFAVVTQEWQGIPVEYWVPPTGKDDAIRTFEKTVPMLEFFSQKLDAKYPYPKYSQSVVHLFQWGGMENTSVTTLHEDTLVDAAAAVDQDSEGLIAHELAHQWFGDMITCRSWPHLWLNEGFATYMEMVWDEHEYGPDKYAYETWSLLRRVGRSESVDTHVGMVSPIVGETMDAFRRPASNPYSKGASVLHMLRRTVGDDVFWRGIRDYVKTAAWTQAESDDLRRCLEAASGLSLERFFAEWVYRGGAPKLKADYTWDAAAGEARVVIEQTQNLTPITPAFAFDMSVWFVLENGETVKRSARCDRRFTTISAKLDAAPAQVLVDPEASVLAPLDLRIPAPLMVRAAQAAPALPARLEAVAWLADKDRDDAREALAAILVDTNAFWGLRAEAAESLGKNQKPAARDALIAAITPYAGGASGNAALEDVRVRRAVVDALGRYRDPAVVRVLLEVARREGPQTIRASACRGLGNQDSTPEIEDTLLACAKIDSRSDSIRSAAVSSLGDLGCVRGLDAAIALGRYGSPYRSRPSGIRAVGRIGRSDDVRDKAREFLVSLLDDPQDRAGGAVLDALQTLGDEEAIPALERFASGSGPEDRRERATRVIDAIRESDGGGDGDIRSRLRALEEFRVEQIERRAKGAGD